MAAILFALAAARGLAATEHIGQVTFNGVAVPGVTVIATQGDTKIATTTNQEGLYRFDLAPGTWMVRIEMIGFAPNSKEVVIGAESQTMTWELTLLPFEEIAKNATVQAPVPATPTVGPPAAPNAKGGTNGTNGANAGFQRANVQASTRPAQPARPAPAEEPPPPADNGASADGLLINGSMNNGAASPFAQPAAFGNNRRNGRSLYTYAAALQLGNSAWDSRQWSISGPAAKQPYTDTHFGGTFSGPLKIPGMVQRRPNLFVGYQHTEDHNANARLALVPTTAQRQGDFSQTTDAFGNAIVLRDPTTGQPFENNQIPTSRLSPQALALLQLYPDANVEGTRNYQATLLSANRQDSVQTRVSQAINNRNQLQGIFNYQRTATESTSLFNFLDEGRNTGINTNVNWQHRFNQFFNIRPHFDFTQFTNRSMPYFANRTDVSGLAGITGNDQTPDNWGPPTLGFFSGIEGLSDGQPNYSRTRNTGGGVEAFWYKGRHNLTLGGDFRDVRTDVQSQQDPRGAFTFNGAYTGSDFGDFLLGIPGTASIAYGNADKFFRSRQYDGYINDDLRLSPSFTVMLGARWEYESPITEKLGRLVNLDTTTGFTQVTPVLASDPTGALTGRTYDTSLIKPDKAGIQPRLALAWRPVPGSSLVVRASYGIYRNTNVYQPIVNRIAQQPPLSRTFTVANRVTDPLTLATAFAAVSPSGTLSTFAIDPDLRVGYAQNWQASVQRDLPASLTVTATYFGTHGNHLLQEILPNSYAPGTENPCPACPSGFVYLMSGGRSNREAGQLQLRRRLRNGLTWTANYTLAEARDNATAFNGPATGGTALAQDWRDLDAEYSWSNFDQRHVFAGQVQYTTGVGVRGGGLMNGFTGALYKGWTVTLNVNAASPRPVTPVVQTQIAGTGVVGVLRADLTGASTTDIPAGYYLNPAAYAVPVGHFGSAGRNSARGANEFALNMQVTRNFVLTQRFNMDYTLTATNLLNRVTYSFINATVGSPEFGLPLQANTMRKIQMQMRLRF
ncbi:MAG TPA: carboxypeptidase regulatory-like domain-containing protein [Vicinamibacterales bacterium]|nr:carboxypeptidase regulatory-like domain-containing protein [Vicinamibacterales bacterium]